MTALLRYPQIARTRVEKKIPNVHAGSTARLDAGRILVLLVWMLVTLVAAGQVSAAMRKSPYVTYAGINSEMDVLWQLTNSASCEFEWGSDTSYALGSVLTAEYGSDHQHRFTIPDLTPGSKYYFRVTSGTQAFTGSFRAAPADSTTHLKFLAYGDTRSNPGTHDAVANAMVATFVNDSNYQSLVISVGDLVTDGNTESYWDSEFFSSAYPHIRSLLANMPYESCMGNHEGTGTLFAKYFPYPFVAGHYWSFNYGPAHFAVLDQYTSFGPGSAQLTWLTNDLATSTQPWKFIVLHEPGWSAGGGHEDNVTVQTSIQPLCEQYAVPIVFGGHNHYYARAEVNGVQHITSGGGGAPLYTPDSSYPHVIVTSRTNHFCRVEIDNTTLHFSAITSSGAVIDTFSITRAVSYVGGQADLLPTKLELFPVYPNPFNPSTMIHFALPRTERAKITVYDVNGRQVKVLTDGIFGMGDHQVTFDGSVLASGVYFARFESGATVQTEKMLLLK